MINPMLCKVFEGDISKIPYKVWFEIKYDGGRVICDTTGKYGSPVIWSRRGNHLNNQFPDIMKDLSQQKKAVFDGELVAFDRYGISDFNLFQRRLVSNPIEIQQRVNSIPATLMVFDIIELDGQRLTNLPLKDRYEILKKTLKETPHIKLTPHFDTPDKLLTMHNIEGIVIKKVDGGYFEGKRFDVWQKLKFTQEATVKVTGYEKHPAGILMITEEGYRVNCNGCQSEIGKKLLDKKQEFKIEIVFLEKTNGGKLRFPSFKRYVDVDGDVMAI